MDQIMDQQTDHMAHQQRVQRTIAVIGTHLPRQCGIATFTTDFCVALAGQDAAATVFAVAVNDGAEGYPYPTPVRFEIDERNLASYRQAADFLNMSGVDLVVLQHEYGIYGGAAGSHVLELLRRLQMPIVSVLHTVLGTPDRTQRRVLAEIARLSDRLVVMSHHALDLLGTQYHVPLAKVTYIPHGIPDVPFVDPNFYKDQFDAAGKVVLLTFGLLSPNKGIEHAITALPAILARYPNVVYIVLGATHPHVRRQDGEAYRHQLQELARSLGVEGSVVFYNQFVGLEQLVEFIGAADVYLTPYLNQEQIVSGTLAYAAGAGKAVISTPYWHAQELLDDGRGVLVPFHDAQAIARNVIDLLDNESSRHAMRKRAYALGRTMIWPRIAQEYLTLFADVRSERLHTARQLSPSRQRNQEQVESTRPPLSLLHLRRMTDDTGLLQHATFSVPNYREGYATDDNARALMVAILLDELGLDTPEGVQELATRYLAFLSYAFNKNIGRFRNFLSYERHWLEEQGSEDSHGRALWALGMLIGRSTEPGLVGLAHTLFRAALPVVREFTSPRAWAFTLLGIHEYLQRFGGDRGTRLLQDELAGRLMRCYEQSSTASWPWFEGGLTYDNATLPRALLLAAQAMSHSGYRETALHALTWLMGVQLEAAGRDDDAHFVPIGCHGFYQHGAVRARFDQQPIEAYATIAACLDAYRVTGEMHWHARAQATFDWFLGQNDLAVALIDPTSGACYDGLQPDGVNRNQGAESTLAYLLASLDLRRVEAALVAQSATQAAAQLLGVKASSSQG